MRIALATFALLFLIQASPVMSQDDVETCLSCHDDVDLTGENAQGIEISFHVSPDLYLSSSHGEMMCVDCHVALSGIDDYPHAAGLPRVDCGECHSDEADIYQWHGRHSVAGGEDLPGCADCHGKHNILPSDDNKSLVNPQQMPATCNRCHENTDLIEKHDLLYSTQMMLAFRNSIHGQASLGGISMAATCNDCHSTGGTAHRILGPGDPESSINHFNIPETCGKCHRGIRDEFSEGIHGQLVAQGETDSPVCTNCHGEHGILSPSDTRSSVSPTRVAEATCSPCHESAYLNEKYGAPTGRLASWVDSYHGLKSKAGDVTVASCASCHGAHRILPKSDTTSSIHISNLQETCGECHPGISTEIALVPIHSTPGITQTPVAGVVANIYVVAIFVIIGAMILHWLIDLRKQIHIVMSMKQVRRMTLGDVWQHTFLMVSFTALAITGFSLRYSEAFWVQWLFGWEGGFPLRGLIHRVAAVVFCFTCVWHLVFLVTRRGRQFLIDMLPGPADFRNFGIMIRYNLGLAKEGPKCKRFNYVEKAEYWALAWGSVVMIVTGFFLWYDNVAVAWFPKGFLDVMLVMHYYEAWLAALAILVWHLYSTVFSPTIYPMNPSWLTGKMPVEQYRHHHPGDPIPESGIGLSPDDTDESASEKPVVVAEDEEDDMSHGESSGEEPPESK